MFKKYRRGIGTVLLKGLHKAPAGVFVNSSVLKEALSLCLIHQTDRGNELYINLNSLPGKKHLFIGLRNVLGISRLNRHHFLFAKKAVKPGNRAGISALHKFYPEDNQSSIRVSASHMRDERDLLRGMLIGMVKRSSGTIPKGVPGAVIASFPAVDILSVSFIFDSGFGDAKFFSETN